MNVRVWVNVQPDVEIMSSLCVIVVAPQPSVAVADPNAAAIAGDPGLQPNVTGE